MAATTSALNLHVLTAGDVRALKTDAPVPNRKQTFLHAIVGSMSAEATATLERRINELAERVDDADYHTP